MLDLTAAIVELIEANDTFKKKNDSPKAEENQKTEQEEREKRRKREYDEDEEDPFAEHLILESLSVKAISGIFMILRISRHLNKPLQTSHTRIRLFM